MLLAIGEAAKVLGVHADTLKGWGDKGPEFTRTAGGHRRYDTDDLDLWMAMRREYPSYRQRYATGLSA